MRFLHILRRLRQSPMFTTITVITLALGIGANAAIFSVLEGVLLKPLAYPDPDRLMAVDHAAPGVNLTSAGIAPFLYFTYRDQNRTLQDIGMWTGDSLAVTGLAEPEEVPGIDLTDGVLPMLGAQPVLGRLFSRQDDSAGSPRTVILSYQYWQSRFGGNASALGRNIVLDGRPTEIIGVLPASFRFLDRKADLFLPMQRDRSKVFLGNFSYQSVARLKPGVTVAQANADLTRMIPIALRSFPPFPGYSAKMFESARLAPSFRLLKQDLIGDIGKVLWVLMGTIGIVLLIACANVANLLLVRTEGRLARTGDPARAGRELGTDRARPDCRKRSARRIGRRRRPGTGIWRGEASDGDRACQSPAAERDFDRWATSCCLRWRYRCLGRCAVRRHTGIQVCRPAPRDRATRRGTRAEPEPGAASRQERAGSGTGGSRACCC